ncbi:dihydropteroate synthase [Bacteroidetes bacterium endosymbiont of Geopemphigus sp.]|uniref:dihydropteroate synthase n=1 Tax=Bacteroidetes bacterium endosymbiont of Geopemphigus sp. TaxID=2047937 RepID=UPI000CD10ECE|nr:dihydropteroate synthase [Bacteroidetes bacterium endosymbiont of Geopemphigus sp.]
MTINCKGDLIDFSEPKIMGIVNLTPDSFYAPSRCSSSHALLKYIERMLDQGADFIDIGACSTRPGAQSITIQDELARLSEPLSLILKIFPQARISVDTFHSRVAEFALEKGAQLINDVSGGNPAIWEIIAKYQVPYILTHSQGWLQNEQRNVKYENIILQINRFFSEKIAGLNALGINDIILDPGIGFGKSLQENFHILRHLPLIGFGEYPLLIGLSRKSMFSKLIDISPDESLNATSIGHTLALMQGIQLLRVHDVKEAKECVKIFMTYQRIQ